MSYYQKNKEKIKQRSKEYRLKNKERIKEYHKKYREEHKGYIKEYRQKNKEKTRQQQKEWVNNNKEHTKAYMKEYYQENKEKLTKMHKEWLKKPENQEKRKEYSNLWVLNNPEKAKLARTKAIKQFRKLYPERVKAYGRAKRGKLRKDICSICGSIDDLHFHHTDYEKDEGITVCGRCHRKVHKEIKQELINNEVEHGRD